MNIKSEKWLNRFMKIAEDVSEWSKDPSSKIGAVIISNTGRILATGYNGFSSRFNDTEDLYQNREFKYSRIIHAEMNALINALNYGINIDNSLLFVYGLPVCNECAKIISNTNIKTVVMKYKHSEKWEESFKITKEIFKECGIEVIDLNNF